MRYNTRKYLKIYCIGDRRRHHSDAGSGREEGGHIVMGHISANR